MNTVLIVSAVVTLIGIGLFIYAGRIISKRRSKASWQQTTGEIVESVVQKLRNSANVTPRIRYTYKVNLAPYESTVISSAPIESRYVTDQDFEALKEKYAVGTKVTVFYNPDDPSDAVIDTSVYIGDLIILFVGGIGTILCGLSFLMIYYAGNLP